jgi:aspartate-semialdehyde dehydrogenase
MYKVAVVGATGNVGREILNVLHELNFPVSELIVLASSRSKGKKISFGREVLIVRDLDEYDFRGTHIALASAGSSVSAKFVPIATAAGCVVIDNASYFRMDPDIPLVVPEVNRHEIKNYTKKNILANPNCSTAQMLVPLKPLHDIYKIKRIVVSTYQSVSGAGKEGVDELFRQTKLLFENQIIPPEKFTKQIAFNCIPHIDSFMADGSTKEEWKMVVETKKILDPNIEVSATCVRVPVFVGHSESVNIEFEDEFEVEDVCRILANAEGVFLEDKRDDGGYATPKDCQHTFPVYVSRIRRDKSRPNCLNMWIVADNVYGKGAALNAVQIARELVNLWEAK